MYPSGNWDETVKCPITHSLIDNRIELVPDANQCVIVKLCRFQMDVSAWGLGTVNQTGGAGNGNETLGNYWHWSIFLGVTLPLLLQVPSSSLVLSLMTQDSVPWGGRKLAPRSGMSDKFDFGEDTHIPICPYIYPRHLCPLCLYKVRLGATSKFYLIFSFPPSVFPALGLSGFQ